MDVITDIPVGGRFGKPPGDLRKERRGNPTFRPGRNQPESDPMESETPEERET
jgi:hypothetical protein